MLELVLGTTFTTVISGPDNVTSPSPILYANGVDSNIVVSSIQIGSTNVWTISFTPNATGVYSLYAFGSIQFRAQVTAKSLYTSLTNLEDAAVGNWFWNKQTNLLTLYRVNGATLATYTLTDTNTTASREKLT